MRIHGEFYPLLSVKRADAVFAGAMPVKFKSISDIEQGRVESADIPPLDQIPINIMLEPTRGILRQGARERVVQLGPSSVDCSAAEHAVQILLLKEGEARSVASLKDVVQEVRPSFATVVSSLFRGPSVAELRTFESPFGVEMDKVYLSHTVLGDTSASKLAGLEAVPWEEGTFFCGSPTLVTQRCWPILRKWAYACR
jgi:hypothetical protein